MAFFFRTLKTLWCCPEEHYILSITSGNNFIIQFLLYLKFCIKLEVNDNIKKRLWLQGSKLQYLIATRIHHLLTYEIHVFLDLWMRPEWFLQQRKSKFIFIAVARKPWTDEESGKLQRNLSSNLNLFGEFPPLLKWIFVSAHFTYSQERCLPPTLYSTNTIKYLTWASCHK